MKFYIETYGCTANQGDSKKIEALLERKGHKKVENESDADTIVINTCIVTKRTELNVLKRIRKASESKNIIVAGCLPAAQPNLISMLTDSKNLIETITPNFLDDEFDYDLDGVIGTVNISNGCVGDCSYCIVKRARGDLVSYSPNDILGAFKGLLKKGAKEIRMTAQDCSAYGLDTNVNTNKNNINLRLPDLIKDVTSIKGDFQVRIGMMNPDTIRDIQNELIDAFNHPKVFKFLHVPVQSGSNRILQLMNRNYEVSDFLKVINGFRNKLSDITLSTDFIIGFPSETEDDFNRSLDLLRKIKAEKVNITRFSPRPYTKASELKDLLDRTKKERSRVFTSVYQEIALELNRKWEGRILDVVVTECGKKGGVVSRDSTYKNIVIQEDISIGERCQIKVIEAKSSYLLGKVVS